MEKAEAVFTSEMLLFILVCLSLFYVISILLQSILDQNKN